MALDPKTQEIVSQVQNGTLGDKLKASMTYVVRGALIGAGAGIVIAAFSGKCRFCFGVMGAALGAGAGKLMAPKSKKQKEESQNPPPRTMGGEKSNPRTFNPNA